MSNHCQITCTLLTHVNHRRHVVMQHPYLKKQTHYQCSTKCHTTQRNNPSLQRVVQQQHENNHPSPAETPQAAGSHPVPPANSSATVQVVLRSSLQQQADLQQHPISTSPHTLHIPSHVSVADLLTGVITIMLPLDKSSSINAYRSALDAHGRDG